MSLCLYVYVALAQWSYPRYSFMSTLFLAFASPKCDLYHPLCTTFLLCFSPLLITLHSPLSTFHSTIPSFPSLCSFFLFFDGVEPRDELFFDFLSCHTPSFWGHGMFSPMTYLFLDRGLDLGRPLQPTTEVPWVSCSSTMSPTSAHSAVSVVFRLFVNVLSHVM